MKNILITGLPGVGKTTIIKKLVEKLAGIGKNVDGFFTEEFRDTANHRLGFRIVLIKDNKSEILADKNKRPDTDNVKHLGQYNVYVKKFEEFVLPIITNFQSGILIIDEIGKMELFSKKFETSISNIFNGKQFRIIATVPVKGPTFVEKLKESPNCQMFTVKRHLE